MRAKSVTTSIAWNARHLAYFDLVGPDWTPPEALTSTVNARRTRVTVRATFTRPDGVRVALTSRMQKDAEGAWWNVGETLRIRLTWRPSREPQP